MSGASLKRLLRVEAAALDRLLVAVSEEYAREVKARPDSPEQRRTRRIERLLAGEPLDTAELAYDFEGWHLGLLASGPGGQKALRALAGSLDVRLLAIPREGQILWAWLGSRRRLDPEELRVGAWRESDASLFLAIGEPGEGRGGWRLTHRQAATALAVALRGKEPVVRYADVALLASVLQDDLLVTSLRRLYLDPLERDRDGGEVARKTLRAYFAAEQNVSSTAAALGVNRGTVAKRLRAIEEQIGRRLASCGVELSVALRLGQLREGSL